MVSNTALTALAVLLLVAVIRRINTRQSRPPVGAQLPPGPPGKPFVGNLPDIPPKHSWLQFKLWADQYGPLYRLNIAGWSHVIVSTERIANDLLGKRGTIYSSRGGFPAAAVLLSGSLRLLFQPNNEKWKRGRKLARQMVLSTKSTGATNYQSVQALESSRVLYDLIRDPANYELWFERYSAGIIFRLTFGKTVETGKEEHVRRILGVVHTAERVASPGAYLVDTFPVLMWIPKVLSPFKRELGALHQEELSLFRELQSEVKHEMQAGHAPPSFTRTFLEKKDEYGLNDDEGAYIMGSLFEAGSGTTAATMMSFMLAMVHNPEWLTQIQREVDEVVGGDSLPEYEHIPLLPKVRAVVKETLRWRPVTAGGVPHMVTEDNVYNGIYIHAGTNVHANQWAIHRDPELYPDPDDFNPSRWLEPKYPTYREPLSQYPSIKDYSAFGFGRRICAGQEIAEMSLNLLAARIAWACDFGKKKNKDGSEVEVPLYDYTPGFNVQPKPFVFDLKARSETKTRIIEATMRDALERDPLRAARS